MAVSLLSLSWWIALCACRGTPGGILELSWPPQHLKCWLTYPALSLCLYVFRMQSLETALKSCQEELKEEKAKLDELKEHFKYNLKLINDRDAELQRYDALFLGNIHYTHVATRCFATVVYSYHSQNVLFFLLPVMY